MGETPVGPGDEDRIVDGLYALAAEELRRRGHPADEPISVAQLCDHVVPYGAVRSALELELKADYDHAVLRLLAAAGERVRLEPEEVREELQRALATPYPDVDAYREYAAARVWIALDSTTPPAASEGGGGGGGTDDATREPAAEPADQPDEPEEPQAEGAEGADEGSGDGAGAGPEGAAERGARAPIRIHREADEPGEATAEERGSVAPHPGLLVPREGLPCSFCSHPLPPGRRVRFCPFCGGDQRLRSCRRCDALLEREWSYCVRCGRPVEDE